MELKAQKNRYCNCSGSHEAEYVEERAEFAQINRRAPA